MMEGVQGALLERCRAAPDEIEPRLAWAESVGGERGELVRLQCELARDELSLAETIVRRRRVRQLLDAHGAAWSELDGKATLVRFDRGFVDAAEISAKVWLECGAEIRERAPLLNAVRFDDITSRVGGDDVPTVLARIEQLLADPYSRELAAIGLPHASAEMEWGDDVPNYWASLGHMIVPLLIASGRLGELRGLELPALAAAPMRALASCDRTRLEALAFRCEEPSNELWSLFFAPGRLPALRALSFGETNRKGFELERILDGLPPTLVELSAIAWTGLLTFLAHHPVALRLERLVLGHGSLGNTHLLAQFPKLRSLEFPFTSGIFTSELDATTMPALREVLHFSAVPKLEFIVGVIERLGTQLELLDVCGVNQYQALGTDDELAAAFDRRRDQVAGMLLHRYSERVTSTTTPLLHLGRERRAGYWDHVQITRRT